MRAQPPFFRFTAATAMAGVLLGAVAPAYAQAPGPQLTAPDPSAQAIPAAGDPPGRVGRVGRLAGTVSFHTTDQDHWDPATLNYPVTSGNSFWTQPDSSADLDVSGTRITLDQATEFTVDTLDDTTLAATAAQGRVFLHLHDVAPDETTTLRTPRGTVTLRAAGNYEITVGDTDNPTLVTVDDGAADVSGPGVALSLGAHQTAQITGSDNLTGVVVAEVSDNFLSAQIAREHPIQVSGPAAPPPAVMQMTGYEAVADTGVWDQAPDYGQVWYPPVDVGWVPYRHGHWAWVVPWGWTWVDEAPWGFAPFHYGRWVEIHDRWAWSPVEAGYAMSGRPVYAPALVTFVGIGAGVAIGVGIGMAVGWIPLGPREVYRPPYAVSNRYLQRVNITNVTNVTNITNVGAAGGGHFANAHAATVVSASAMQHSMPVAGQARPLSAGQQAGLQPLARPNVQPTLATRGVTPAVAQSMHLQPAPGPAIQPHAAPGPNFQARPANAGAAASPVLPTPGRGISPAAGAGGAALQHQQAPALSPAGRPAGQSPVAPGAAPGVVRPAPVPQLPPAGRPAGQPPVTPGAAPGVVRPAPVPQPPALPPAGRPAGQPPVAPGAAPGVVRPAPVPQPQAPALPPAGRPAGQPPVTPGAAPGVVRPAPAPVPHPQAPAPQPQAQPQPSVQRPQPQAPAPRPQPQAPAPRPQPQAPAPRPQPQAPAPRPQPQAPAPRPQPQAPAPRPQPQAPAARPAPAAAHRACPANEPHC